MYDLTNLNKYFTKNQIEIFEEKIFEAISKYDIDDDYYDKLSVSFNTRLRTVSGKIKYFSNSDRKDTKIELNPKYMAEFGFDHMLKTFAHELAHLIQFAMKGDTNHNNEFKRICVDLNGHMNSYIAGDRYKEATCTEYITNYKYHYKCDCGVNDFKTKRRLGQRKLTGTCNKCNQSVLDFEYKLR